MLEKPLLGAFLEEIIAKCDFAQIALERANHICNNSQDFSGLHYLFEALIGYLHHTASISLVLWPSANGKNKEISKEDRLKRGEELRTLFGISGSSIFSERKFRDHIAHMDERLEDWHLASKNKNRARFMVGSLGAICGHTQLQQQEIFETFDPRLCLFAFRGETFDIGASFSEVRAIRTAAIEKLGRSLSIFEQQV